MTVEFLEGKRKKFISPVTLFLFLNLIYFFVNPLSDYSLSFEDQYHSQPYSSLIQESVVRKLQSEGLDPDSYAVTYQRMSDTISKSIMILNIPLIAMFVYLIARKKRRYYYDSLIFSFHFFTLLLASLILSDWIGFLCDFIPEPTSTVVFQGSTFLFLFMIPLLYAILGLKRFICLRWSLPIPAGLGVIGAVVLTNLLYRFLIFGLTFWAT